MAPKPLTALVVIMGLALIAKQIDYIQQRKD